MPPRIPHVGGPRRPAGREESKAERDRFYCSRSWRKLRAAILRERPLCERCLAAGFPVAAQVVHHKVERLEAPDLAMEPANLESLCHACHTSHHHGRLCWHSPQHAKAVIDAKDGSPGALGELDPR